METLHQLRQGLEHAVESLTDGWRELGQRATGALTRFKSSAAHADEGAPLPGDMPITSGWAFLAADVFEDDDKVVVRLEAPGLKREDFDVELHGDVLSVRGEKRFERETGSGRYRVVQCAYGSFRREVALPVHVQADKTRATYRDGVLRIEMPKAEGVKARRVDVHEG
ncbi:Hsp20/alpha crystallin family protein [Piscinibacter sp. XHJ-5]|uniref:Hsp20/alpha crystallin family protein n=1 Tax=Piscinibacter sp. XHJ-5 TaxID=3037797 RepID=UPI002453165A|nr:Hsp20/alpha crystallin family protein [Piscinibacter sp. XHJ-5]